MSSEWIKHDESARCPVEDDAIVHLCRAVASFTEKVEREDYQ